MSKSPEIFYLSAETIVSEETTPNNKFKLKSEIPAPPRGSCPQTAAGSATPLREALAFNSEPEKVLGKVSDKASDKLKELAAPSSSTAARDPVQSTAGGDRSPSRNRLAQSTLAQSTVTQSTVTQGSAAQGLLAQGTLVTSGAKDELQTALGQLVGLIANVTEAYSVALFLGTRAEGTLRLAAAHTLSRELIADATISFNSGLVGWTAENAARISVCPFEHDATTLLYYSKNQDLKSFIAVPILDEHKNLIGVIACDSKKSYAFAKITEKILYDCAAQAALAIGLCKKLGSARDHVRRPDAQVLATVIEHLRTCRDEDALLTAAAKLPPELIARDALVVMTTAEGGVGSGTFYSTSSEENVGNRLFDLVCKHKKVICSERSVHALPLDDQKQRSFLSVPFHVLDREAGSFNLLSKPSEAFGAPEISALEELAKVLGAELERIRLREKFKAQTEETASLTWKQFSIKARCLMEDAKKRSALTFIRIAFRSIPQLEELFGVEASTAALGRVLRLAGQVAQPPGMVCGLYGQEICILVESAEAERTIIRLRRLIEKLGENEQFQDRRQSSAKLGALLLKGMEVVTANGRRDGESLEQLAAKTRELLQQRQSQAAQASQAQTTTTAQVKVANAGNW